VYPDCSAPERIPGFAYRRATCASREAGWQNSESFARSTGMLAAPPAPQRKVGRQYEHADCRDNSI
jgi:hypothetical protein